MTTPTPQSFTPETRIEKMTDYTEKTATVNEQVAKAIGHHIAKLIELQPEAKASLDPEALQRISEKLFNAADTLIYLAEDVRALGKDVEANHITTDKEAAHEPAPELDERGLTPFESELFFLLKEHADAPLRIADILSHTFSDEVSGDQDEQKRSVQKAIKSIAVTLDAREDEFILMKVGQTRGTRYYVTPRSQSAMVDFVEPAQAQTIQETPLESVSTAAMVVRPPVPMARHQVGRPTAEQFVNPHTQMIDRAVQELITADPKRPILCTVDITRAARKGLIPNEEYELMRQAIESHELLRQISKHEFHIVGRDLEGDWVDHEGLEQGVHEYIATMTRKGMEESRIGDLLKHVGRKRRYFTTKEREVIYDHLKKHPQFDALSDDAFMIDATREAPVSSTRSMTYSEINKRINELGLSRVQPFHRR